MADYVIGVDCSTTATKAVVWDREGKAVAEGKATFEVSSPQPDWGEQNTEDWWASTKKALREATLQVDTKKIGGIGVTHQRETFVCVDEEDRPMRPAILWLDSRPRGGRALRDGEGARDHGQAPEPNPGLLQDALDARTRAADLGAGSEGGRRARVPGAPRGRPPTLWGSWT